MELTHIVYKLISFSYYKSAIIDDINTRINKIHFLNQINNFCKLSDLISIYNLNDLYHLKSLFITPNDVINNNSLIQYIICDKCGNYYYVRPHIKSPKNLRIYCFCYS